jgi:hypothetical protein
LCAEQIALDIDISREPRAVSMQGADFTAYSRLPDRPTFAVFNSECGLDIECPADSKRATSVTSTNAVDIVSMYWGRIVTLDNARSMKSSGGDSRSLRQGR